MSSRNLLVSNDNVLRPSKEVKEEIHFLKINRKED